MRKRVLISALAGIAADLSGCGKDADVLEYSFNRLEMAFFDECVFTEYLGQLRRMFSPGLRSYMITNPAER